jgi:hypothetical protein
MLTAEREWRLKKKESGDWESDYDHLEERYWRKTDQEGMTKKEWLRY